MDKKKKALITLLMPISAHLDDFLGNHEYLDSKNPDTVPGLIDLMNTIQQYVNDAYKYMGVTASEWKELSEEVMPAYEQTKDSDDKGAPGFRQDDLGSGGGEGQPSNV